MFKLYRLSICLVALCLVFSGNELSALAGRRHAAKAKPSKKTKVEKGPDIKALAKREKHGKLSKAEKRQLANKRAAIAAEARRRAEEARRRELARLAAIRAAQLRAIAAHEAALKNGAAANIMNDDTTGQDPDVRSAAIQALDGKAGTVVVMDATNGKVYAVVNQRMAIGSPVKPCSTVKPIVSLAALQENVFDPNVELTSSRGRRLFLTDAIAHSDNPFFQELGRRLGYDKVIRYAQNFGFGQATGVNLPSEDAGFIPDEFSVLMSSHGDGFGVTAMQLATFTAAIANGGNLYVPRIPKTPQDAANFKPQLKRKIDMSPESRMRMLAGMAGAVSFGTGRAAFDPIGQVAGKTGTCTDRDKLGLFTSFNSVDNPKLVVTVITTGRGEAGKKAADIAGRVYRAISYRFLRDQQMNPILTSASKTSPTVNPVMSPLVAKPKPLEANEEKKEEKEREE